MFLDIIQLLLFETFQDMIFNDILIETLIVGFRMCETRMR